MSDKTLIAASFLMVSCMAFPGSWDSKTACSRLPLYPGLNTLLTTVFLFIFTLCPRVHCAALVRHPGFGFGAEIALAMTRSLETVMLFGDPRRVCSFLHCVWPGCLNPCFCSESLDLWALPIVRNTK